MNKDIDPALIEKIESYLSGQMPPAESSVFRAEIAENPALKETVDLFRLSQQVMEVRRDEQIRAKIKQWSESPPPPATSGNKKWVTLAVSVAVILIAIWYFSSKKPDPATDTPAASNLKNDSLPAMDTVPKAVIPQQETQLEAHPAIRPAHSRLASRIPEWENVPQDGIRRYTREAVRGNSEGSVQLAEATRMLLHDSASQAILVLSQIPVTAKAGTVEAQKALLAKAWYANKQYAKAADYYRQYAQKDMVDTSDAKWNLLLCLLHLYPDSRKETDHLLDELTKSSPKGASFNYRYRDQALQIKSILAAH